MTKEELLALKKAADEAKLAYYQHRNDGSIESDVIERKLLRADGDALVAYTTALDLFIDNSN